MFDLARVIGAMSGMAALASTLLTGYFQEFGSRTRFVATAAAATALIWAFLSETKLAGQSDDDR